MSVVGDASLWSDLFPDKLIPEILDLVISAWETFDKPQPGDHEVPITMRFRTELIRHKRLRKLPLLIDREIPEDDLLAGKEKGGIDLRFIHGYQEGVYFAFECKRLNVLSQDGKRVSLARRVCPSRHDEIYCLSICGESQSGRDAWICYGWRCQKLHQSSWAKCKKVRR